MLISLYEYQKRMYKMLQERQVRNCCFSGNWAFYESVCWFWPRTQQSEPVFGQARAGAKLLQFLWSFSWTKSRDWRSLIKTLKKKGKSMTGSSQQLMTSFKLSVPEKGPEVELNYQSTSCQHCLSSASEWTCRRWVQFFVPPTHSFYYASLRLYHLLFLSFGSTASTTSRYSFLQR